MFFRHFSRARTSSSTSMTRQSGCQTRQLCKRLQCTVQWWACTARRHETRRWGAHCHGRTFRTFSLKSAGTTIPSYLNCRTGRSQIRVYYDGQPQTCKLCSKQGHVVRDCPEKKSKDRTSASASTRRWEQQSQHTTPENSESLASEDSSRRAPSTVAKSLVPPDTSQVAETGAASLAPPDASQLAEAVTSAAIATDEHTPHTNTADPTSAVLSTSGAESESDEEYDSSPDSRYESSCEILRIFQSISTMQALLGQNLTAPSTYWPQALPGQSLSVAHPIRKCPGKLPARGRQNEPPPHLKPRQYRRTM